MKINNLMEKYNFIEKYIESFKNGETALNKALEEEDEALQDLESAKLHFTSALTLLCKNSDFFHSHFEKMANALMKKILDACENPEEINDLIDSHIDAFPLLTHLTQKM